MAKRVSMKAQLEAAEREKLELRHKLEQEEIARANAEDRADELVDLLEDRAATEQGLEATQAAPATERTDADLAEPRLNRDPFDSQNPHAFLSHPPGYKLGWKYPKYRNGPRGWRGWTTVEYTDEIGQNLSKYLNDPPRRHEHADDNTVRRGDSVLSIIDERYWAARQQKRLDKANRYERKHDDTGDGESGGRVDDYRKKNPVHTGSYGGSSMMPS